MGVCGTGLEIADFRQVWPVVRARAKDWIEAECIEQAAAGAATGAAACLMSDGGIVVLTLAGDSAYVLLAVAAGIPGAVARHEHEVVAVARDMGARRLAFRSDRRGWKRALGASWHRRGDLYERTV